MSSIAVGKLCVSFKTSTPICGNCKHEKRTHNALRNRTDRTCTKNGWFVLMSSTCNDHEYRQPGATNAAAKS